MSGNNLILTFSDGTIANIENFQSGELGLTLSAPAQTYTATNTINGDLTPVNYGTGGSTVYHTDSLGNIITSATADANLNDILYGDGGNDIINTGGGNNVVVGMGGNDTINAGAGNDIIVSGDISAGNYVPANTHADVRRGRSQHHLLPELWRQRQQRHQRRRRTRRHHRGQRQ